MNTELPKTADEYILCFRQLTAIIVKAMDHVEANPPVYLATLDRIAHNVETIACLRGDSGIYQDSRPPQLGELYQKEMYDTEYALRERLIAMGYVYPTPRPLSDIVKN